MEIKDNIKRYWAVWFLLTGALIITRFTVLTKPGESERFFVFCFYIPITWVSLDFGFGSRTVSEPVTLTNQYL